MTDTRNDVKTMVDRISAKFTGGTGPNGLGFPLNPKREDYVGIRCWKQADWLAYRNGARRNDTKSTTFSLFMEDGTGAAIPEGIRDDLRDSVHGFWKEMTNKGKIPTNYSKVEYKTKEDFRVTMEGKYPWLRLCEGHWKVKQVWRNCFSIWKKTHLPEDDLDDAETKSHIDISSGDDSSTGSKRGHNSELDTRPLKKHKGKEVAPNFHPARPLPKKKIPKASTSLCFHSIHIY